MGIAGRQLVIDRYVWQENVELMVEIYRKVSHFN
jgi:hypothetical protein